MKRSNASRRRSTNRLQVHSRLRRCRRVERLESRLALSADVAWTNPNLSITDDGDGLGINVDIWADGNGWVEVSLVNGGATYWDGSQHNCKASMVASISVTGSVSPVNGDIIDLTHVKGFPFAFDNIALPRHISVSGMGGNDTISLGDLNEYANGGFGNDSIVGGSGNDTIYGGNADGNEGGYDYINGMGGDDDLYAESTAAQQNFIAPGVPKASSTVYGGSGND